MNAPAVLDRYFLEMRSKALDIAAALDRIERAQGAEQVRSDERLEKLREAVGILLDGEANRAARIQMVFSDAYEPSWPRPTAGSSR
jgi:hypothetical protein